LQPQYGGRYYPPGFAEEQAATLAEVAEAPTLEEAMAPEATARAEEATRALAEYETWKETRPGLITRLGRVQEERRRVADEARMREATLAAEQAERAAQLAADQADFEEAQAQGMEARRQAHEFGVTKAKEGIAAADKDIATFRIQDRRDTGTRIMHGLASALGALGAGLAGMPNFAMQQIERQIDRDINSQREELQSKRAAGQQARNDLAAYNQQFGNEEAAIEATRRLRYREYANQARSAMAQAQSTKAKSALNAIAKDSDLRAQEAETRLQLGFANEELLAQQAALRAQVAAREEGRRLEPVEEVLVSEKKAGQYRPELGGFVDLPPEQMARVSEEFAALDSVDQTLAEMERIIEKGGTEVLPGSVEGGKLITLASEAHARIGTAQGKGALSTDEQKNMARAIPEGTDIFSRQDKTLAQLRTQRGMTQNFKRNRKKYWNIEPGVLHRRRGPKGKLQYSATFVEPSPEIREQRGAAALERAGRAEQ
jgi:hypothetical protein